MALVTTARLKAVYAMLRAMPPFHRWDLPDPQEIKFEILAGSDFAEFSVDEDDKPCLALNAENHITLQQVAESLAHEMVHLRQEQLGRLPDEADKQHNAEFRRLARLVCRDLGFDVQRF